MTTPYGEHDALRLLRELENEVVRLSGRIAQLCADVAHQRAGRLVAEARVAQLERDCEAHRKQLGEQVERLRRAAVGLPPDVE